MSRPSQLSQAPRAVAAPAAADLDAFEERAAIAEHHGGLAHADAERVAAEALGFADAAALYAAAADGWRRNLEALARRETSKRGRDCIAAALRFIAEGWAAKAAALGWTEPELFGADPRAPWERLDRLGAAYSPFAAAEVTRDAIRYREGPTLWRAAQTEGAASQWATTR